MVSVVCAVKDRTTPLKVSLTSWLSAPGVGEVVIVDWDSEEPVATLAGWDKRVRVVRVEGMPRFHLAAAFNLAADVAGGHALLKLDADYILNPFYDLLGSVPLPEGAFVTGHIQPGGPFMAHMNGLVYVRRADWLRVHGYNENLTGYGWDDDDFYERLSASGLRRHFLLPPPVLAFHIPHDNSLRVRHYDHKDIVASHERNRIAAAQNRYAGRVFSWSVEDTGDRTLLARPGLTPPAATV